MSDIHVRKNDLPAGFTFMNLNQKPALIIRSDGYMEVGEGCTNLEAATELVELANRIAAQNKPAELAEQQGDALSLLAQLAQVNRNCHSRFRDYDGPADCAVQAAIAALAARQPGAQVPDAWVPAKFFAHGTIVAMTARRAPPSATAIGAHGEYVALFRQQPAQGIDLGQLERLANSWIVEAAGAAAEAKHACADELLALIDGQRAAAPGVGNG